MFHSLVLAVLLQAQPIPASPPMNTFPDWLAGCWTQGIDHGTIEEHWMAPSGGSMIGMGRTVQGGKTLAWEFLRIAVVADRLVFIANPSGQRDASFPLKYISTSELVFENPTHDFPQRVIYQRGPAGTLNARVEGTTSRGPRREEFTYKRC